jgi:23S rRNA maturation mini-RNase III
MSWTPQYDNEQLTDVSADEATADAPQDEDEEHRRIRRAKNAKRAQRRRNTQPRLQTKESQQRFYSSHRS